MYNTSVKGPTTAAPESVVFSPSDCKGLSNAVSIVGVEENHGVGDFARADQLNRSLGTSNFPFVCAAQLFSLKQDSLVVVLDSGSA